jgi:hypothetical protein
MLIGKIKKALEGSSFLSRVILQPYRNYRLHNYYRSLLPLNGYSLEDKQMWLGRIRKVKASSDNKKIDKIPEAGQLKDSKLIMHNGLVIDPLSYYGAPVMRMLMENEAVHEPQEEYVFQEILKQLPKNATMVELGCYWGFYSMWFNQKIKGARNILIDNKDGVERARTNFKMNGLSANFMEGYIGKQNDSSQIRVYNVDEICSIQNIEFIDVLHSDIQGFELEMLETMPEQFRQNKIGYIFISTHSNELHYQCIDFLEKLNFKIVCQADLDHSFSEDGLIVAKSFNYSGIDSIEISHYSEESQ